MIVGYFAWVRTNRGGIACEKFWADWIRNPEATKAYQARTVGLFALTADQYQLSLDELAKIFPAPMVEN